MPARLALPLAIVGLLSGCAGGIAGNYSSAPYVPPPDIPTVAISYVALNQFQNYDRLRIALITRPSCEAPAHFAELATLGSSLLGGDRAVSLVEAELPADQPLQLYIDHLSTSGLHSESCEAAQTYTLAPGRAYQLRIANWSTTGSVRYGFGCEFNVFAIDPATGAELERLTPTTPPEPDCAAK